MNWSKANRIIDDVICIVLILILPLWALKIIGIERVVWNESKGRSGQQY